MLWTISETRNLKVFKDTAVDFGVAEDTIKFRVACWFKHHGRGLKEAITSILLNISELCKDSKKIKHQKSEL